MAAAHSISVIGLVFLLWYKLHHNHVHAKDEASVLYFLFSIRAAYLLKDLKSSL